MYGACRAGVHPHGQVRPEVLYQRQRASPDRLNNSARRTYDLLRSTLVNTGRSMLLVESELTDALSASRNTVRTVLQQLAREGLVVREPKNGTRGTEALLLPIDELAPVASRRLECRSLGCPPIVRDRLRLPAGWTVLMIESLMFKGGLPLGISVNYIALPEGTSVDFDDSDVILILEQKLGVQIGGSQCTVGAVAADEQSAELIDVKVGAPLIWLEDVIEDNTGQPRALSQLRLRGDRVAFSATARRPS
ncbi:GntR family transcriptional regulator [Mycolicibacterium rhodesiae]|uniref:GntR family transcriptional regulator n=2 Tax=Mycolicibacterium rhodesiae TaxID=36814 RepID=A0A1X0J6S5_MYCRH|nr:GntR family transcriptional regulator [Mycolicibacterium rhodesiae]ORB57476.1 GntR family transcriptional regulator [Mycolicibacterium rhodesiae]